MGSHSKRASCLAALPSALRVSLMTQQQRQRRMLSQLQKPGTRACVPSSEESTLHPTDRTGPCVPGAARPPRAPRAGGQPSEPRAEPGMVRVVSRCPAVSWVHRVGPRHLMLQVMETKVAFVLFLTDPSQIYLFRSQRRAPALYRQQPRGHISPSSSHWQMKVSTPELWCLGTLEGQVLQHLELPGLG